MIRPAQRNRLRTEWRDDVVDARQRAGPPAASDAPAFADDDADDVRSASAAMTMLMIGRPLWREAMDRAAWTGPSRTKRPRTRPNARSGPVRSGWADGIPRPRARAGATQLGRNGRGGSHHCRTFLDRALQRTRPRVADLAPR